MSIGPIIQEKTPHLQLKMPVFCSSIMSEESIIVPADWQKPNWNKHNQTAFLFLKPQGNYINRKILLRNREGQKQDSLTISPNTSNRQTHLENVKTIGHWLEQESGNIEVLSSNKWTPIFERKKEKQAFLHSLNDFLKITGRH